MKRDYTSTNMSTWAAIGFYLTQYKGHSVLECMSICRYGHFLKAVK